MRKNGLKIGQYFYKGSTSFHPYSFNPLSFNPDLFTPVSFNPSIF